MSSETDAETTETEDGKSGEAAPPAERQWPVVIALRSPIDFGSQRVAQLEIRRGRFGDLKGLKLSDEVPIDHLLQLASRLSGQPQKVIEQLDADDAGEVMSLALDFYGACLGGGREALAVVAHVYHFQPSELWAMESPELEFWLDKARWLKQRHG